MPNIFLLKVKMAQSAKRTLETLVGPLAQTFPQLERATILHSDQLTTERRINPKLRDQWFYTADSSLYVVEREGGRDEVFLYLGRGETNPVFNNIEEAVQQLMRTGNYIPPKEDVEAVKSAGTTLRVKLSDLRLQGGDSEWRYFEIDTANYHNLNPMERRVVERVYGQGDDFIKNMEMFNDSGIRKIRVYVLNPDYVKQNVLQDCGLVRASGLFRVDGSMFGAFGRGVDGYVGLRGVRNVVAEGDTPKSEDPIAQAYLIILRDPALSVQKITPQIATGLSGLLQMYKPQKQ